MDSNTTISPEATARTIAQQFSGPLQPRQIVELAQLIQTAIEEAAAHASELAAAHVGELAADRTEDEINGYRRTLISVIRIMHLAHYTGKPFDGDALIALINQRLGAPRNGESLPLRLDP